MSEIVAEPLVPIHRLTVEQYHRMIETAVLTEDDRVEFLEGWIVTKMPHNPLHAGTITGTQHVLEAEVPEGWIVRSQLPVTTRDSEPEPDIAVVSGPKEKYFDRHPTPFDTALVIEIADSTLEMDREAKGRLYARARIPVYWIINLPERVIEVYTRPVAGKRPHYRDRQDFGMEDEIPLVIDVRETSRIPARGLLPPR